MDEEVTRAAEPPSPQPERLHRRVARGALWALMGACISQGLALAASVVAARLLGKTGFGEWGMIRSTVGTFGVFAGLGLGLTATKYVSEYLVTDRERAGRVVGLVTALSVGTGGLSALVLLLAAPLLAATTLNSAALAEPLRLGCLLLLLETVAGAQIGALSGLEAFRTIATANLVRGVVSFPLMVGGAWLWGVSGITLGAGLGAGIGVLVNQWALHSECHRTGVPIGYAGLVHEAPLLVGFSLPAFISNAMYGPVLWVSNAVLAHQPNGYGELGVLGMANTVRTAVLFLPGAVFAPLLPILSSQTGEAGGGRREVKLHTLNAYAPWYLATVMTVVLLYVLKPLVGLFGKSFEGGTLAVMLVLCSVPISTYSNGLGRLIQARALMWYGVASNALWGTFLLVGTYCLARYGAVGLGIAYLLAYAANSAIMVPIYFRQLAMSRLLRMDGLLGLVLTLSLLPAVAVNVGPMALPLRLALTGGSLLMVMVGGLLIRRWMREAR